MNSFLSSHPVFGFILTLCAGIISYIIPELRDIHFMLKTIGQDLMILVAILTGIGTMFKLNYRELVVSICVRIRNKFYK
jgi:hypothetical protein